MISCDYYAKSPLPGPNQGIARGSFSVSHSWCEGHVDRYFLTGDRRSLETALKIADHYNVYRFNHYDFTNCRDSGWHLILTLRVRAKITSEFGGSAAGPDARREGGSVSAAILDRPSNEADCPAPPRPYGLGAFGSLASLLTPYRPLRVCSSFAPRQRAKFPPAKSEVIFARTLSVYRATGDPFYLNAARIIIERVLERQTLKAKFNSAAGGWRRMMLPGHCLCEPAHYGNAGFMVGVLLTGLKWYHLETRDARVSQSLIAASHFLIDDMWVEDVGGFRYTSCPKSSAGAWSNFLLFDGMAYAYRLTQQAGRPDARLAEHLRKGTAPAIQAMSGMGKSFSQFIRVTPHFMGVLAELTDEP